jgi:hypothetical protein
MGILNYSLKKQDKIYIICSILTILLAIMSGIVLFNTVNIDVYFVTLTNTYIYNILNFANTKLFFSVFFTQIFYLFIFFVFSYILRIRYITLIFIFIRVLFYTLYTLILCTSVSFGGLFIFFIVFLPYSILSLCCYLCLILFCQCINSRYIYLAPLILALGISIIYIVLINIPLRIFISIV